MLPTILLTNKYSDNVLSIVKREVPSGFKLLTLPAATSEELLRNAPMANYFLASGRLRIDREIIKAAARLKMIQRTGVGADTLDLRYLEEKDIPVYINRGVNSSSVAEHTLLLILSVLRRLPSTHASIKNGEWRKNDIGITTSELRGKKVGLIGLGNIGKKVAGLLQPFNAKTFYYDQTRLKPSEESKLKVTYLSFHELLQTVDILSLHCALTQKTRGILGSTELALMKPGAFIVNTARGPLIDQDALEQQLQTGHIAGAGLDVFNEEPLDRKCPILTLDNVVLTPHVGGLTRETFQSMIREAMGNIKLFEDGRLSLIQDKKITN